MLKHQHLFYRKVRFLKNNKARADPGTLGWISAIGETDEGDLVDFTVETYISEFSLDANLDEIEILDEYDLEKKAEAEERRKNRENTIRVRVDEHGAGHIIDEED